MSAVIYQTSVDKCLILDTRQAFIYPFTAPNWLDLRIGFYLSLCKASNNADITGLAETLTTIGQPADRFWIGIKQNNSILPQTAGTTFVGWGRTSSPDGSGSSTLVSSDIGVGTTNSNYWRNGTASNLNGMWTFNGTGGSGGSGATAGYIHFPQNAGAAGGNATLVLMKLIRATGTATSGIGCQAYFTGGSAATADYAYDSVCSIANIRSAFRSATFTNWNASATMNPVPDALFFYWPFSLSKLRIHAVCLEKFA
jgi:hypothetical protein